jgi:CUB/sushi domain-containing protein
VVFPIQSNDCVSLALDCGDPGTPANGQKIDSNYTFPNSLRYVCDRGFRLVGSSRRDCQTNGLWSGTSASCISE